MTANCKFGQRGPNSMRPAGEIAGHGIINLPESTIEASAWLYDGNISGSDISPRIPTLYSPRISQTGWSPVTKQIPLIPVLHCVPWQNSLRYPLYEKVLPGIPGSYGSQTETAAAKSKNSNHKKGPALIHSVQSLK